ncbi:hypothetical protein SAMN04487989_1011235 [Bizionia echini]|uniref:Uncharacterized protein n=1 Tax=Bizionia echini TaxID=649333 RepID=A0A1I5A0K7_9FLAO|nr:hypothetical protein [Bizionia echini]SFN55913.1 hypothetical protein SAMN04487989_1011235 [Bizionia echini]
MQNSHNYTCNYCFKEYKPTKRGRQKFCTTSCRVAHFNAKKKIKQLQTIEKTSKETITEPQKDTPKVNLPDITNAAIGHAASSAIISFFTPKNKKPVTKQDLDNLKTTIQGGRYRPVLNCPQNDKGETAYFDLERNEVIFSFNKLV